MAPPLVIPAGNGWMNTVSFWVAGVSEGSDVAGWRVDPDGVIGVLTGMDRAAAVFTEAAALLRTTDRGSASGLAPDGRTTVLAAWEQFISVRQLVPDRMVMLLDKRSSQVAQATADVVLGDREMAETFEEAEARAEADWGIRGNRDYWPGGSL